MPIYHSYLLKKQPPKLLLVKVGNMRLAEIKGLFKTQVKSIIKMLNDYDLLELHKDKIVVIE